MVLGPGHHHAVHEDARDPDLRGLSSPVVRRSTWTITRPPEFFTAWAMDSASSVRASRSIVTLPSGSAVVPRSRATLIGRPGRGGIRPRTVNSSTRSSVVTRVEPAALQAGVDEGVEADARDQARPAGGDVPVEQRDHALREAVGLDLFVQGEHCPASVPAPQWPPMTR